MSDSHWILPKDPDYPHSELPEMVLPSIPIRRNGWFFDLRDQRQPRIFYDGKLVGRIQKVAFKIDANDARMMCAHLEISDPAFVISLDKDSVEVETSEQPEP